MKLVCVAVLSLVTVVTANPYGYGVKGGALAAAKADSSAATASIPGIAGVPLSIPSSGRYTGSFSKSSSSSFASSGASSSSGSFTFSGSGTVPSGYSVNGISGSTKCTSGNCPTGNYGTSGAGTGDIGHAGAYSGANAAAGAGAIVFPGSYGGHNTECFGGACKPVCEGDSCGANTNIVTTNTDKKCASGDCNVQTTSSTSSGYGSNDIYVSTSGSKNPSNKPSGESVTGSHSTCTYGNCNPTAPTGTKQSYPSPSDTYHSAASSVSKPSPSLIAPKEEEPCISPDCGSSSYNKENPSSYNVPVYPQNNTPCKSGNCAIGEPHLSSFPTTPSASSTSTVCAGKNCGNSIQSTSGSPSKTTINSASDYPDFVPLAPTGSPSKPGYTETVPTLTAIVPTGGSAGAANSIPGYYEAPKRVLPLAPMLENKIPYTGGFGGPPGILKPNEFSAPSTIPLTDYKPAVPTGSQYNPPALSGSSAPIYPIPCTSGNCGSTQPSHKPAAPTTSNPAPCVSGDCGPQAGQFTSTNDQSGLPSGSQYKPTIPTAPYKPTNCIFGNCGIQSSQSTSPQFGPSGAYKPSGSYTPAGPTGSANPIVCSSGNCGGQPQPSPSTPPASYRPTGCSTGNCGLQSDYSTSQFGQGGSYKPSVPAEVYKPLNPSETYKPSSGPICSYGNCGIQASSPVPQHAPNGSYNPSESGAPYNPATSSGSYKPTCSSGKCGTQPSQSIPQYGQNPSYKPLGPTGAYNPSASLNPNGCISGNCGYQLPQSPSQFGQSGSYISDAYNPTAPTGPYGQTGCASGNCESPVTTLPQHVSSGSSYNPSAPTGTHGSSVCSTGHCGLHPNLQTPTGSYNHGSYNPGGPSGCTSGNCQPISPGSQFNRPSTSLGSYTPSGPSSSYEHGCATGNCAGSFVKPTIPTFGAPAGILKPNEFLHVPSSPIGSYKPDLASGKPSFSPTAPNPSCTSGKCGAQPGLIDSHAIAGAAASANEITYTGGFGGPPGLLQPYDGGKLPVGPIASGSQIAGNVGSPLETGVHSSYGKSLNGAFAPGAGGNAQVSAITGAAAGSYGGSKALNGGDDKHVTGGCKGGCGGSTGPGYVGAAAKSTAQATSTATAGAYSGGFASSSASAHSSASAATKGGYGRR